MPNANTLQYSMNGRAEDQETAPSDTSPCWCNANTTSAQNASCAPVTSVGNGSCFIASLLHTSTAGGGGRDRGSRQWAAGRLSRKPHG